MSEHFTNPVTSALRDHAMTFPETSEGASCVNRAFKARKKNFLFVGEKDDGSCKVMLKLGPSLDEAIEMAGADTGLADMPLAERDLVLEILNAEPVNRWLDVSYVQTLPDSPFAVAHLESLPKELAALVQIPA